MALQHKFTHSYCTKRFTFNPETKVFSAEVSDLASAFRSVFSPVYVKADTKSAAIQNLGLPLRSEKTGAVVWFLLVDVERDPENDILGWVLQPSPEAIAANPALAGVEIHIFND